MANSPPPAPSDGLLGPPELPRRAVFVALARVAAAALRFRPPFYLQAVFGPVAKWLGRHRRGSELTLLDWRRPRRAIAYLVRIAVPSVNGPPPGWARRVLPAAVTSLFWRPTTVFEQPVVAATAATAGEPADRHAGERWFFINGVATTRPMAELNAELLVGLFGRPLTVIQNSTNSLLVDLWDAAIGKGFKNHPDLSERESFTEPSLVATVEILEAINDPAIHRVVVFAHSEGTIIAANVVRAIARAARAETEARDEALRREHTRRIARGLTRRARGRLEPLYHRLEASLSGLLEPREPALRDLEKLEVYTFANCADTMKYVSCRGGRHFPWLEHFANERDLVARLGVLSPLRRDPPVIDIDGPLYLQPAGHWPSGGWGHLLNEHYLLSIGDFLAARADGSPATHPYAAQTGAAPEPRLYGYFAGASPDAR